MELNGLHDLWTSSEYVACTAGNLQRSKGYAVANDDVDYDDGNDNNYSDHHNHNDANNNERD